MSTGKKRFWSDDEKREICGQTRVAGVSVAMVARRYAVNANLIHKWLRDPKFAADVIGEDGTDVFLPVEIEGAPILTQPIRTPPEERTVLCVQRIDLTLSDGRRILQEGATDLASVLGLIKGLMP